MLLLLHESLQNFSQQKLFLLVFPRFVIHLAMALLQLLSEPLYSLFTCHRSPTIFNFFVLSLLTTRDARA